MPVTCRLCCTRE